MDPKGHYETVTREPNSLFWKSREKCRREKCLLGRNVAPDIFDQKSREKTKLGRNVAGRNVVGEKCHQGEMSFSPRNRYYMDEKILEAENCINFHTVFTSLSVYLNWVIVECKIELGNQFWNVHLTLIWYWWKACFAGILASVRFFTWILVRI